VYNGEFLEIFEFINTNDKFILINSKKAFYLLDAEQLKGVDLSKNESNRKKVIEQLIIKTDQLKEQLNSIKGFLPNDVEIVLKSYLDKISGVEFLDDLQNVDEQTNILDSSNAELMKYELDEDFSIETAVQFGRLYKKNNEWRFEAVGAGMKGGLQDYLNKYN
jgi:hypothetical protein